MRATCTRRSGDAWRRLRALALVADEVRRVHQRRATVLVSAGQAHLPLEYQRLAPDIAERLLFITLVAGQDWITERLLRGVFAHLFWGEQRRSFDQFLRTHII